MLPAARTDKLTAQELADETLVFDHETGKAHCLNRVAGLVWKHCDGRNSAAELARRLGVAEAAVELALEQLQRRGLVEGAVEVKAEDRRGRRDALRKLVAAAALLPAIMTITAPMAMAQASVVGCQGRADGQSCNENGGTRCCSEVCMQPLAPGQVCNGVFPGGNCACESFDCDGATCN